jgi:hypothetical protein
MVRIEEFEVYSEREREPTGHRVMGCKDRECETLEHEGEKL